MTPIKDTVFTIKFERPIKDAKTKTITNLSITQAASEFMIHRHDYGIVSVSWDNSEFICHPEEDVPPSWEQHFGSDMTAYVVISEFAKITALIDVTKCMISVVDTTMSATVELMDYLESSGMTSNQITLILHTACELNA